MTPFRVATLSTIEQQCTCMPYLELEISKAVNVPSSWAEMTLVAQISQNLADWQTQPAAFSEAGFVWNEVFAVELDLAEEFSISLLNGDSLVAKLVFPPSFAGVFLDEDVHRLCLRLAQGRTQFVDQEAGSRDEANASF